MPDDLWISGGGSNSVATDELYGAAQQLAVLAGEASTIAAQLASLDDIPGCRIDGARTLVGQVEVEARLLGWALTTAADNYGSAEAMLRLLAGGLLGGGAGMLGAVVPRLLPALLPVVAGAILAGVDGKDVSILLSRRSAVDAVRAGSMIVDDLLLSVLGIPAPLIAVLGDEGLGVTGLPLAASAIVAGGAAVGLFRETPVRLASAVVLPAPTAPPTGFAERFTRIPSAEHDDGAQVVIEKYETEGEEDRFAVYVGGTVTFDPVSETEPWDMTSNMANAVGPGSGSYDSVAQAMAAAGIDGSSPVQFTGYSQGGGTVAQLAASGDYNTQGLVTFGGPTGQVGIPEGFPTVIVEHRDDIVPALGGTQQNTHAVIVERDVYGGRDIPQDEPIPAHHRGPYRETAELMDAAQGEQLHDAIRRLDSFAPPGATVTSTAYRFERVSDDP